MIDYEETNRWPVLSRGMARGATDCYTAAQAATAKQKMGDAGCNTCRSMTDAQIFTKLCMTSCDVFTAAGDTTRMGLCKTMLCPAPQISACIPVDECKCPHPDNKPGCPTNCGSPDNTMMYLLFGAVAVGAVVLITRKPAAK